MNMIVMWRNSLKLCLLILGAFTALSQAQENDHEIWALGLSIAPQSSPAIAGTAMWAKELGNSQHFAFAVADVLPTTKRPFLIENNFGIGIAEKAFHIRRVAFFVPLSLDVSDSGRAVGWAWSAGGMASLPWREHWHLLPNLRVVHSDVSNNSGAQLILGLMIGWEK